jgi:hypothetical protein
MEAFFADIFEKGAYNGDGSYNEGADLAAHVGRGLPFALGQWGPVLRLPTPEQAAELEEFERRIAEARASGGDPAPEVKELEAQRDQRAAGIRSTLVTLAAKPREVRVLPRGNWTDRSGEVVLPAVPAALGGGEVAGGRRLDRRDLAAWITSRDNPLAARAFANRVWALFFGHGLSRDLSDLGNQGRWPTHPELLDWLAVEFIESGWDVAHLVTLITTSRTYQQTSDVPEEAVRADPGNRLFGRQVPRRLEAEFVRDNALAIAGLLEREVGGPSVRPYQPDGYYANLNFPKRGYDPHRGRLQYRRGLYTHWQRTFLHPMLIAFDAPAREECTAARPVSNTPLQALDLLNDPTFVEAARVFAARLMTAQPEFAGWLDEAFLCALSRRADPEEVRILTDLYWNQLARYQGDPAAAEALLGVGFSEVPGGLDRADLAAHTAVARAVLNLHETITRF